MRDFNHTLSVLVKAYFDGTLQHGNCHACAVGNIVAESNKVKFTGNVFNVIAPDRIVWDERFTYPRWQDVFITATKGYQTVMPDKYEGAAKEQIDATGYTWQELSRIEYAFENAACGKSEDDYMFNGLMAVVSVLSEIHNIDLETTEKAKALFVKH